MLLGGNDITKNMNDTMTTFSNIQIFVTSCFDIIYMKVSRGGGWDQDGRVGISWTDLLPKTHQNYD